MFPEREFRVREGRNPLLPSSNDRISYSATSIDSRSGCGREKYESNYSTLAGPDLRRLSTESQTLAPHLADFAKGVYTTTIETQSDILHHPIILPTVVVSSPTELNLSSSVSTAGRVPITAPITESNFSRPRPPFVITTPESEEQKRRVLERNRRPVPTGSHAETNPNLAISIKDIHQHIGKNADSRLTRPGPLQSGSATRTSPLASDTNGVTNPGPREDKRKQSYSGLIPGRSFSPVNSIYSTTYSYYEYDNMLSSPTGSSPGSSSDPSANKLNTSHRQMTAAVIPPQSQFPRPQTQTELSLLATWTPQEYLQKGIQHHEANQLKESATCFELSATKDGGCGVGMLMWGLALRHGWGCEKNERFGFKWLRRAAESAVTDLENTRKGGSLNTCAVQSELVLAIYEVGQSFFQGWGVPKDQKMAVSYYTVAARLGDPDAQSDLGFCLANGRGCKKNRKEAAKWYRAAVAQGQSDVGLAWIYKEKFQ